jgi:transposase
VSTTTPPGRSSPPGSPRKSYGDCCTPGLAAVTATRSTPRLYAFSTWCADAQIPELTTLAETIETRWPAVLVFLQTEITNARTEGFNRQVKHTKRAPDCDYC